ncbi:hypothetical protein [Pedobacter miscanthi]|nr:hypothetical protein [Pedobacter miscanthi]
MFIVDLKYIVPLEELDGYMKAHVQFLKNTTMQIFLLLRGEKYPVQAALF